MSILNMFCSKIFHKIKSFCKIFDFSIDINSIDLKRKLNQKNAINNFDNFLSFYGLNQYSNEKLWIRFLFFIFWFGFIKISIINLLDPVMNYNHHLYIGDFTILFKNFRKF